jgi:hypothetical protein
MKAGQTERGLSFHNLKRLGWMYVQFAGVFILVIILTYHAARVAAVYKFMKRKQGRHSYLDEAARLLGLPRTGNARSGVIAKCSVLILKAVLKGMTSFVVFSPAYVIAYAFKTELDSDSLLFMVLLAVVSNGLLVNYANKFYTFLVHESRKGYVETAAAKGLDASYTFPPGLRQRARALFTPLRAYSHHIFSHVYMNACFQYISAVKEQAAFLITGLIIIEMALNIQGHLCYELLQSILFKDYEATTAIVIGIFLLVKITELTVDAWYYRESQRYENIPAT